MDKKKEYMEYIKGQIGQTGIGQHEGQSEESI